MAAIVFALARGRLEWEFDPWRLGHDFGFEFVLSVLLLTVVRFVLGVDRYGRSLVVVGVGLVLLFAFQLAELVWYVRSLPPELVRFALWDSVRIFSSTPISLFLVRLAGYRLVRETTSLGAN